MGQNNSINKRITKDERKQREQTKNRIVQNRVGEIEDFQKNIVNSISNNALTTQDGMDLLLMSEKIKTQVNRGGATLTKTDLIAIIVVLTKNKDVSRYNNLSISDLNTIIRSIIYNPKMLNENNTDREDSFVIHNSNKLFLIN